MGVTPPVTFRVGRLAEWAPACQILDTWAVSCPQGSHSVTEALYRAECLLGPQRVKHSAHAWNCVHSLRPPVPWVRVQLRTQEARRGPIDARAAGGGRTVIRGALSFRAPCTLTCEEQVPGMERAGQELQAREPRGAGLSLAQQCCWRRMETGPRDDVTGCTECVL